MQTSLAICFITLNTKKKKLLFIQQQNNMTPMFPCGICAKAVAKNHNAVCCDICNLWVYIKCNSMMSFKKYAHSKWANFRQPSPLYTFVHFWHTPSLK